MSSSPIQWGPADVFYFKTARDRAAFRQAIGLDPVRGFSGYIEDHLPTLVDQSEASSSDRWSVPKEARPLLHELFEEKKGRGKE